MSLFSRMTEEWNEQLQKAKDGDPEAIKVLPTLGRLLIDYLVDETNQRSHLTIRKVGRCDGCRWWTGLGTIHWGTCDLTEETKQGRKHPDSKAYAAESAEYDGAWLNTAPDFGCVQWERG